MSEQSPVPARRPGPHGASRSPRLSTAPAAGPITTLIVDDHVVVREGMRRFLEGEGDIRIVGEADDGRAAIDLNAALRPDVILMDIGMPQLNGIEATRRILIAAPATRVVIVSAHPDHEYVERAEKIGACGYVLKHSSLAEVAAAIRIARAHGPFVRPHPVPGANATPVASRPLSAREFEVLQLVAEGSKNRQTARILGISIKTVEKHRQSLMLKLDLHDVAGLTRYAIATGAINGRAAPPSS